jgi:hypothetical protein
VEFKGGTALFKGMRHRDWLPFRTCLLQMLQRPFVFSCTFAICSFHSAPFPFLLSHDPFPHIRGNLHHVSSQLSSPLPASRAARCGVPPLGLDRACDNQVISFMDIRPSVKSMCLLWCLCIVQIIKSTVVISIEYRSLSVD